MRYRFFSCLFLCWLGIFGLAAAAQEPGNENKHLLPNIEEAISKEGIIAGTFQDTATDKSFEVEGTIDTTSQRAAWGPVGESWPIMETGIFNLTESEAGALLHFDENQTQQWSMIRLDDPQPGGQNQ